MKKILTAITITNLMLLAVQFIFSCLVATQGDQVRILSLKKTEILQENAILADRIYKLSALSRIESQAQKLGMIAARIYPLSRAAIADADSHLP